MQLISERLKLIKESPTLAVVKKANELKAKGINIINLGAGEPDFDTPDNIKDYAIKAIKEGFTKYTSVDGYIDLKKAIAQKFLRENGIKYELDEISVSTGAKQVLFNALLASINPNDEVIIPTPYWVSYPDMVALAEGKPVFVETSRQNGFKLQPEKLIKAINSKTKWVIINSPNNPSGAAYTKNELKAIIDVVAQYNHVGIIADDIYEHIRFDDFKFYTPAQIASELSERILTVNGVSKAYSMTGWRIGYCGGPKELIKAMNKIQSQSTSNPCSISQKAAFEALNGPQKFLAQSANIYKSRRDLAVNLINKIPGLNVSAPEGAFYLFVDCEKLFGKKSPEGKILINSNDIAEYFLEVANVAVVSGLAFGMDGYFRISYVTSEKLLNEALNKIKSSLALLT